MPYSPFFRFAEVIVSFCSEWKINRSRTIFQSQEIDFLFSVDFLADSILLVCNGLYICMESSLFCSDNFAEPGCEPFLLFGNRHVAVVQFYGVVGLTERTYGAARVYPVAFFVPMSRPSMTIPFSRPICCWRLTMASRTKPSAATMLTLDDTASVRMSFSTNTPSR